ncbi:MAG: L-threonylcarbamoyladenylate synthase [Candidatus Hodarchaeales archaeon]|jgi:L-threonylcarbamoyladenylate synthase
MRISVTDPQLITVVTRHFREGGIVVFPTDTCYGLGTIGLKWNESNIKKIYEIKSRPLSEPLSLLITKSMIPRFISTSSSIREFLVKIWPGRVTAVLFCETKALEILSPFINHKNPRKIAFRVPKHELLLKIIEKLGNPIIGTSANKTGSPSKYDIPSIFRELPDDEIHLWVDAGRLPKIPPSTVVDLSDPSKPILLRNGNVNINQFLKGLKR